MILHNFNLAATEAAAEESGSDIFGALGINWQTLVLQTVAFLVLLWALKKWVYPVFIKAIDDRQAAMDAGVRAAEDAKNASEAAERQIAKQLDAARKQADEILVSTQKEAASIVSDAEAKATRRAEVIVAEAKADMNNQLLAAREELKGETRQLVAQAAAVVLGEKVDAKTDAKLIDNALKQAESKA